MEIWSKDINLQLLLKSYFYIQDKNILVYFLYYISMTILVSANFKLN